MSNYSKGDMISIKAEVVRDEGNRITLKRKVVGGYGAGYTNFEVRPDQVDRVLERALPGEPDRQSILRGENGRLFSWRDTGNIAGWCASGGGTPLPWDNAFYQQYGPFDVFEPDRSI